MQRVREVLTGQGFGVLTEIDVRQTLQRKPVDRPELREVADEASRRLDAALAELTG